MTFCSLARSASNSSSVIAGSMATSPEERGSRTPANRLGCGFLLSMGNPAIAVNVDGNRLRLGPERIEQRVSVHAAGKQQQCSQEESPHPTPACFNRLFPSADETLREFQ